MEAFLTIVQSLGFPIACVIALGYFVYKIWNTQAEVVQSREDRMLKQIDKFNDTLQDFNTTLITIDNRLENLENKVENNKEIRG